MGKKKKRSKQSLELPEDLITDIISRVPDKDLMRFTCVSNSWRSLINSTDSYLSQLRSQRSTSPFLVIKKQDYVSGGCGLYHNYRFELDSIEDRNPKPREIHNPFDDDHDSPRRDAYVIASCEGLLVLQHHPSQEMAVLNPTTKERHVVPPNPAGDGNVDFIGFGYDRVHGHYKLVTIIRRDDRVLELMIYNVDNGTWKKSRFDGVLDDDCRFQLSEYQGEGKCVDGALYWCDERQMKKILCFVLAEEEFHKVDPPCFDVVFDYSPTVSCYLTVFDGWLCFVCYKQDHDKFWAQLWLMECDYKGQLGSSYSRRWIEFLVISDPKAMLKRFWYQSVIDFWFPSVIPICFSACENKILVKVEDRHLFWYDIGKNKFRRVKNRNINYSYMEVHVIVPSLVRIGR